MPRAPNFEITPECSIILPAVASTEVSWAIELAVLHLLQDCSLAKEFESVFDVSCLLNFFAFSM